MTTHHGADDTHPHAKPRFPSDAAIERAMRRGLELATRGPAGDPNPRVGSVILDPAGTIVAEGWHRGVGTPHAETDALSHLGDADRARAGELTAVVTLEPCNHTGHTGPCALALIDAGIGHVVYALSDPGKNEGGGGERLRAAGVHLRSGVLESEARELLRDWLATRAVSATRPRVIAKWAQSLDGRAAAADGTSQWITGPEARADVHRRRAAADAILVGTGTVLADDPALTARTSDGGLFPQQPRPVVLGRRDIPAGSRVFAHPALTPDAPDLIHLPGRDLAADLAELSAQGITSVFVEGGPTIISALLSAGLVDELLVYVAPVLLGGPRVAVADLGIDTIADAIRLNTHERLPLGEDTLFVLRAGPSLGTESG